MACSGTALLFKCRWCYIIINWILEKQDVNLWRGWNKTNFCEYGNERQVSIAADNMTPAADAEDPGPWSQCNANCTECFQSCSYTRQLSSFLEVKSVHILRLLSATEFWKSLSWSCVGMEMVFCPHSPLKQGRCERPSHGHCSRWSTCPYNTLWMLTYFQAQSSATSLYAWHIWICNTC
jgi:hypothetical protein